MAADPRRLGVTTQRRSRTSTANSRGSCRWPAQLYVAAVIVGGVCARSRSSRSRIRSPCCLSYCSSLACLTSLWKVNLPIAHASGSTLSVSYAANLMALLLLGPQRALIVAVAGVWTQCTYKVEAALSAVPHGVQHRGRSDHDGGDRRRLRGLGGRPRRSICGTGLAKPLVGAIATYFFFNTGLVAGAIALRPRGRSFVAVWQRRFPVERRQLHGGRQRRRAGGGGGRAAASTGRRCC